VLLIIFMITATVIQSSVQIDVPKTEIVRELSENLLVVSIDEKDNLYLQDTPVRIGDIAAQVKEKLPLFKRQSVYFRADRKVSWETTTRVLDVLTQAGITNVMIVTEPLEGK
jgi:biopolymer transport protein ExbD